MEDKKNPRQSLQSGMRKCKAFRYKKNSGTIVKFAESISRAVGFGNFRVSIITCRE
jgi:hypothetical protein